jgi:transcriptional regulator GlxA family with amidase domain
MRKAHLIFAMLLLAGVLGCLSMREAGGQSAAAQSSAQSAPKQEKSSQRNLAIFIFEGVQIIDYTGPYEVFGQAHNGQEHLFNIYTVAEKAGPITTNMGMTVVPKYTFETMPKADVLLLPGGGVRQHIENPRVIKWVQDTAAQAEFVVSVCNGAFYLGKAGLLDGLTATTFYGLIDELRTLAPKAKVVTDQRFTDNGKIITTAGLSSGIDGALHLVERIVGRGRAQEVALNMEYNWQPDAGYARASFADIHLRRVLGREGFKLPDGTGWKVLGQQGGRDQWEKNWEVRINSSASDLLKLIDSKLAEKWSRVEAHSANSSTRTMWKFTDEEGKAWNAVSTVQTVAGEKDAFKLTIRLARSDSSARLLDE